MEAKASVRFFFISRGFIRCFRRHREVDVARIDAAICARLACRRGHATMEPIMTFVRQTLAPLAFVSLLAAGPAFAQSAQEIDVALTSYAFTPSALTLHANTTYRLHLVNSSRKGHNFAAPEFFAASTISPADAGKITSGAIEVDE